MLEQLRLVGLSSCRVCHLQLAQTWLCLEDLLRWNTCHWQSSLPKCVTALTCNARNESPSACLPSPVLYLLCLPASFWGSSQGQLTVWTHILTLACLRLLPLLSTRPSHRKVILFSQCSPHIRKVFLITNSDHSIHSQSHCQTTHLGGALGNCLESSITLRAAWLLVALFPGSRAWAGRKEPGTHCLHMLSFPRISGNLEISHKPY